MRPPASRPLACHFDQAPFLQSREKLTCRYLGEPGTRTELGPRQWAVAEEQLECRAVVQPAQQTGDSRVSAHLRTLLVTIG